MISVSITARNTIMTLSKVKKAGLNMPFRATSIMPLENEAPNSIPRLATISIVLKEAALEPMAELRKFTASLLTPTIKSIKASKKRTQIRIK